MIASALPGSFRFIWGAPLLLSALTVFGLVAALLGSGLWHSLAWLALAAPIITGLYFGLRPHFLIRGESAAKQS